MDNQSIIQSIFKVIDLTKIRSSYVRSMISSFDHNFICYLSRSLSTHNIMTWIANPNNIEILSIITDRGWDFYNYVYLNNSKYYFIYENIIPH